jgi:hypothetical protein
MVHSQFNNGVVDDWPRTLEAYQFRYRDAPGTYISHCSNQSGEVVFSRTAVTNLSFPMEMVQNASMPIEREIHEIDRSSRARRRTSIFAFAGQISGLIHWVANEDVN